MKPLKLFLFSVFALIALASCEHDVSLETTVHEDGKLDKVIALEKKNNSNALLFNLQNWERSSQLKHTKADSIILNKVTSDLKKDSIKVKKIDYEFTMSEDTNLGLKQKTSGSSSKDSLLIFKRSFHSAEEANAQLANRTDSTLSITSSFAKKFRWFYTYITYSETYHAINRLEYPIDNYVTPEDYAFIDRLPAEGKKISQADSLYLSELNKKLFDVYGLRALFEAYWNVNLNLLQEHHIDRSWTDTLHQHKEQAFALMTDEESENKDMSDYFMIDFMERLHIPLPYETVRRDYMSRIKPLERTTNFMTTASDGKFTNRINMPWTVVGSNADSVAGNSLFWLPPTIKFLLKDYTMQAESRRLNWWAVMVSALVVGFTVYVFIRKRN